MSTRAVPPRDTGDVTRALADIRRSLDDVVRDPFLNARTVTISLPDGVEVRTRHGLGRPFTSYSLSAVKGAIAAGYIVETTGDATTEVVLTANSFGATITTRLTVW